MHNKLCKSLLCITPRFIWGAKKIHEPTPEELTNRINHFSLLVVNPYRGYSFSYSLTPVSLGVSVKSECSICIVNTSGVSNDKHSFKNSIGNS
jgi:hypothetical protein